MKIVLFGATGMIGSRILQELLSRGHQVTAVVRDASKMVLQPGMAARSADVLDPSAVAAASAGAEAVISAYAPGVTNPDMLVPATKSLIEGVTAAGVKRLIMVGGAASLEVAPGVRLIDSPDFPPAWRGIAQAHIDAKDVLAKADLDWTSVSPAAMIEPGERTGRYRSDPAKLVMDAAGNSRISAEDYAIALVDELEQGTHIRQRFGVGY